MKRVERVRLYPNSKQDLALRFMLDVTRELYNALLLERRDAHRLRGIHISTTEQYREITDLRSVDKRVASVHRECEDAALRRLHNAFAAFNRRLGSGNAGGFPRFKAAKRWKQLEFPHGSRSLKFDRGQKSVRVPGSGKVKLRKGRVVPEFGRAWIVERNGRWYANFECERIISPLSLTSNVLGVDRGVRVLAATSDGNLYPNAAVGDRRRSVTSRLQREAKINSGARANERYARSREREANGRRDRAHKVARALVRRADVIVLEKLNVRSMTRSAKGSRENPGVNVRQKAGLNRAILDAGFGLLRQMIVAKAEEAARTVVEVDARYSSQTCSRCGYVDSKNRRKRRFFCLACGFTLHADVNAALELRRRAELRPMSIPEIREERARGSNTAKGMHNERGHHETCGDRRPGRAQS